jgi:hypothetical protein
VPREIARGVNHRLVRGRDRAARRVVIHAEVHRDATPARRVDEVRQVGLAARVDDRLRRLDHQLEAQRICRQPEP